MWIIDFKITHFDSGNWHNMDSYVVYTKTNYGFKYQIDIVPLHYENNISLGSLSCNLCLSKG